LVEGFLAIIESFVFSELVGKVDFFFLSAAFSSKDFAIGSSLDLHPTRWI